MSHVTDIILITSIEDGADLESDNPNVDKLKGYLEKEHNGHTLLKVDGHAGGNKAIQCDVFMAAFNYFNIDAFVRLFKEMQWQYPESAQLLIKDENDDAFTVYTTEVSQPNH